MSAADDAMGGGGGGYDIFVVEVHAAKQLREVQSLLDQDVYAVATVTPGAAGGPKQRTGTVQDDFVDRAELDLATLNRQPVDRPSSSMGQAVLCERGTRPTPRDCFPSPGRAPVPRRRAPPRRSRVARRLRTALLVLVLLDAAVLATAAAAPALLAAHAPPPPPSRARQRLLAVAPVSLAVATASCTGKSVNLAADQCDAWGQFFDSTNGVGWTGNGQGCSRTDPCGCLTTYKGAPCSADGTSITVMCVPLPSPLSSPSQLPPPPATAQPSCRAPGRVRAGTYAR
jgi:hypothetical protein